MYIYGNIYSKITVLPTHTVCADRLLSFRDVVGPRSPLRVPESGNIIPFSVVRPFYPDTHDNIAGHARGKTSKATTSTPGGTST